jgi:hypothetical protein
MTLHRNIAGAPGPIVERADRSALASDYRRILMRLHQCDTALRHLDSAALFVGTLRNTSNADIADLMADALNMIDDARSQIEAARVALDASITPAMEDA